MKKLFFFLLITCLMGQAGLAQKLAAHRSLETNQFKEIQRNFYKNWDSKLELRGNGYKQFKRWEALMEPRVGKDGIIPNIALSWKTKKNYITDHASHEKSIQSTDSAYQWQPLGPDAWQNGASGYNPGLGRINCVVVHPLDSNIIFVGTPAGGIWKSNDAGQSWSTASDDLPILGVTDIVIHPTQPDIMYMATGDYDSRDTGSIGVLKSTDGGETWETTGMDETVSTDFWNISRLEMNPDNPDEIVLSSSIGLWKTSDAGANWELKLAGNFADLEYHPTHSDTLYAAGYYGYAFHYSYDGGESWTAHTATLPGASSYYRTAIAVSPDAPDDLYIVYANPSFQGLYRSSDAGQNFTLQSNSPNIMGYDINGNDSRGQGWYDLAIVVNPENAEEVYVGGIHIWKSENGGQNWDIQGYWYYPENAYPYVHADIHALEFYGSQLYTGCDGGIFRSSDQGNSWEDLSEGLTIMQFYRLGQYAGDDQLLAAGAQDNGCNIYNEGTWTHVFGADGMECIIDYDNPNTVYIAYQGGGIQRSDDGGSNFVSINNQMKSVENGAWVTPYVMHPTESDVLYAGYENVWKSTDKGSSWEKLSDLNSGMTLRSLVVAPSDDRYIYTATLSNIYRTTSNGFIWEEITQGLPFANIVSIAVAPDNPKKLWVTFSGYEEGEKVYRSDDAGSSWTNVSGSLPNVPVNCIIVQRDSEEQLYIGTDVGVFHKNANMEDWELFSEALPNVIVNELEIHEQSRKLRAATFGRGLWEVNVIEPFRAAFAMSQDTVIAGATVQFTAQTEEAESILWEFEGADTATSTDENPQVTYETPGSFLVKLTVSRGEQVSSLERTITVLEPVTAAISFEGKEYLDRDTIRFSSTLGGNPDNLHWTFEGGTPAVSTEESPVVIFETAGTYLVTLQASNAYDQFTDSVTLIINEREPVVAAFTFDETDYYLGDTVRFTNTSAGEVDSYLWTFDGGTPATSTEADPTVIFDAEGERLVTLQASNAYDQDEVSKEISILRILAAVDGKKVAVQVYPNPVKDKINIAFSESFNQLVQLKVTDMKGVEILSKALESSLQKQYELDLSEQASGYYVLQLTVGDKTYQQRILKQ